MSETVKGICPHCGKLLEIPAGLEKFSCLYCGARMGARELRSMDHCAGPSEKELNDVEERLLRCVTDYPEYYKKMGKQDYLPAFERYEAENREVFERLSVYAMSCPQGRDAMVKEVVTDFLNRIEVYMQENPRWESKRRRDEVFFETKVVLALYLTPLARKLKLPVSEAFRSELHRQWMQRWPKQVWQPGDYETMVNGFRKLKFCFITTATCCHEGKPDDCAELTAFRAFRDGWLRNSEGGEALIQEYYALAPAIVACIEYCDDSAECYAKIRSRWLESCYRALREERPADCRRLYVEMVQTLRNTYHL